jgi:hypothetical protein
MSATPFRTTTNSSPPMRLTVSPSRTPSAAGATPSAAGVADVVAERIVDVLEAVEVDEQHRHPPLVPVAPVAAPRAGVRRTALRLGSSVSTSCSARWLMRCSSALRSLMSIEVKM